VAAFCFVLFYLAPSFDFAQLLQSKGGKQTADICIDNYTWYAYDPTKNSEHEVRDGTIPARHTSFKTSPLMADHWWALVEPGP
jgi:hypothetical protein